MKKIILSLLVLLIVGGSAFYGGFRVGEFNGRVETAALDTGPLMNLLLSQAGMQKELADMNRSQLYSNLSFFDTMQSSRFVTPTNKKWLKQNILLASDYWNAAGGTILETEEEAKKQRQRVAEIRSATGVQMGMSLDGVRVSPFHFEEEDRRVRDLFTRYSGQTSALHDMIVDLVKKSKNTPNQALVPTPASVTPAADAPVAPAAVAAHL